MQDPASFREFYDKALLPELQELEEIRKDQLYRQIYIAVAILLSILVGVFLLLPFFILVFLFLSLGVYFIMFGMKRRRFHFKQEFKSRIIYKMAAHFYPDMTYTSHQFVPESEYIKSGIFVQDPDVYNGEDMFQGKVGLTDVTFSEIHTQDRHRDADGRTTYTTIFRGIFLLADFHKHFKAKTYVLSDFGERYMGYFGAMFQQINLMRPGLVKLENEEFEKYFVVYSTDETEARYILSPALMERLLQFRKRTGAAIQCSFVDERIYIALPMRDKLFEPSLYKTVLHYGDIEEFRKEMEFCVSIIDELNLNTRIWSKD